MEEEGTKKYVYSSDKNIIQRNSSWSPPSVWGDQAHQCLFSALGVLMVMVWRSRAAGAIALSRAK